LGSTKNKYCKDLKSNKNEEKKRKEKKPYKVREYEIRKLIPGPYQRLHSPCHF